MNPYDRNFLQSVEALAHFNPHTQRFQVDLSTKGAPRVRVFSKLGNALKFKFWGMNRHLFTPRHATAPLKTLLNRLVYEVNKFTVREQSKEGSRAHTLVLAKISLQNVLARFGVTTTLPENLTPNKRAENIQFAAIHGLHSPYVVKSAAR